MSNKHLIVSVESRKGGVGKTTAALVLAKIFLEKNYRVLFLDLDLTGTNVIDSVQSPFWSKYCNALSFGNDESADIIDLFLNHFMSGKKTIQFINEKSSDDIGLHLEANKINIIGSEIFNPGRIKTSILFDELHSFWFTQFLQEIHNSLLKCCVGSNTIIILDNSPGYIGFVSKIHDWLTDIGPKKGKFLIISSLDNQDLLSCSRHLEELHQLFLNKCAIAVKKQNEEENPQLLEREIPFYLRLIEDSEALSFYYQRISLIKPQFYLAFIINKALSEIVTGTLLYDFSFLIKIVGKFKNGFFQQLSSKESEQDYFSDKMIPYDENIEYQFLINRLYYPRSTFRASNSEIIFQITETINKLHRHPRFSDLNIGVDDLKYYLGIIGDLKEYQSLFNQ